MNASAILRAAFFSMLKPEDLLVVEWTMTNEEAVTWLRDIGQGYVLAYRYTDPVTDEAGKLVQPQRAYPVLE